MLFSQSVEVAYKAVMKPVGRLFNLLMVQQSEPRKKQKNQMMREVMKATLEGAKKLLWLKHRYVTSFKRSWCRGFRWSRLGLRL